MNLGQTNTPVTAFPNAVLRPMAGVTELAVAAAIAQPATRPVIVTAVLSAAYETVAEDPVTPDLIRGLPCGTREWLLQRAARHFCPNTSWFEATCIHCGKPYDLSLNLADAPRRHPNDDLWETEVATSLGVRSFSVPTGAHEEALDRSDPREDPRRVFATLCGLSDQAEAEARLFSEHDLELIDEALESASPDVADEALTTCPSCKSETAARIDPLEFAFPREGSILQEAHLIASAYGWSLDQILNLSVRHRSILAAMIAREQRPIRSPTRGRSA